MPDHDIDTITALIAAQVCKKHPDWRPRAVWLEVMRAISGRGDWAEFYHAMRGRRVPHLSEPGLDAQGSRKEVQGS